MREKLSVAIHQFAKRQRTWFRGMERRGISIEWIDGELPLPQKVSRIIASLET
jgi:tRNA dimethylallyltransferase